MRLDLNYVDVAIGLLLTLAFVKGFISGLWVSLFGLAGTLVSFIGAYFLTSPAVNYVEQSYGYVTSLSKWWENVFVLIPGHSTSYDPNAVADFFAGIDSAPWLRPISALIKDSFLEVEVRAGATATWCEILSSLMSQIMLSGIMFVGLLMLLRMLWSIFSRALSLTTALSFPQRVLGGFLQLCLSGIWLSLFIGAAYPLIALKLFDSYRLAICSSYLIEVLLNIYKVIIPTALLQINSLR